MSRLQVLPSVVYRYSDEYVAVWTTLLKVCLCKDCVADGADLSNGIEAFPVSARNKELVDAHVTDEEKSATHVPLDARGDEDHTRETEQCVQQRSLSMAAALPPEVLTVIFGFGQVGHVCTSWSLASIGTAHRRFASLLTDTLRPVASNAVVAARAVEQELFAAYNQRCGSSDTEQNAA